MERDDCRVVATGTQNDGWTCGYRAVLWQATADVLNSQSLEQVAEAASPVLPTGFLQLCWFSLAARDKITLVDPCITANDYAAGLGI